jgi:hypothetical protein
VRLPFKFSFIFAFLLSLPQLSFDHFNKHFLCFYFGNLDGNIPMLTMILIQIA